MKTILLTISVLLHSSIFSSDIAMADKDRGGASVHEIDQTTLTYFIESGHLKRALLDYLESLEVDQIQDKQIQKLLTKLSSRNKLQEDINASPYIAPYRCPDIESGKSATTRIGKRNDEICFDIESLLREYRSLTIEETLIRLASVALHEHVHHFQNKRKPKNENEEEGLLVSAYVRLTAKIKQIPSLKWEQPKPKPVPPEQSIWNEEVFRYCMSIKNTLTPTWEWYPASLSDVGATVYIRDAFDWERAERGYWRITKINAGAYKIEQKGFVRSIDDPSIVLDAAGWSERLRYRYVSYELPLSFEPFNGQIKTGCKDRVDATDLKIVTQRIYRESARGKFEDEIHVCRFEIPSNVRATRTLAGKYVYPFYYSEGAEGGGFWGEDKFEAKTSTGLPVEFKSDVAHGCNVAIEVIRDYKKSSFLAALSPGIAR